jgi:hypothetical protein
MKGTRMKSVSQRKAEPRCVLQRANHTRDLEEKGRSIMHRKKEERRLVW